MENKMKKKKTNENIFDAGRRFTDAFFDGLKNNATDKMLSKSKDMGVPLPIIDKMKKLQKEKEELDDLIKKYSK
jgi:hypothetical protein